MGTSSTVASYRAERRPGNRAFAAAHHEAVREFLQRVHVLPWHAGISEVYGPGGAATQREGRVLLPIDILIGTHALSTDAVIVTNDRALKQFLGLSVEDWTEGCR